MAKVAPQTTKETLTERLKALRQAQKKTAPSMIPQGVKPVPEEAPVPDISELGIDPEGVSRFNHLAALCDHWGREISQAKKQRDIAVEELKQLCATYSVQKVMADSIPVSYFATHRHKLDAGMLMAAGISARTIADCTVTSESWTLRVGVANRGEKGEDNG